jgi:hypothetical protein
LDKGFNTSANILINGLSALIEPKVAVDYNDDSIFDDCTSANGCNNLSFANGNFVFNVSHFTTYKAVEGTSLLTCGDFDKENSVYHMERDIIFEWDLL